MGLRERGRKKGTEISLSFAGAPFSWMCPGISRRADGEQRAGKKTRKISNVCLKNQESEGFLVDFAMATLVWEAPQLDSQLQFGPYLKKFKLLTHSEQI